MNRHYRLHRMPDSTGGKNERIHYRWHTVFLVRIERFGRVAISYAKVAFRRFARPVRCGMHRNTRMPQNQGKEDSETDTICGESHTISDQQSRELFRRA